MPRTFEYELHPQYHTNPVFAGVKTYRGYPELMDKRFAFGMDGYTLVVNGLRHRIFEKRPWGRIIAHKTQTQHVLHYCLAGHSRLVGRERSVEYKPGRLFAFAPDELYHHDRSRPAAFESVCLVFCIEQGAAEDAVLHGIEFPRRYIDLTPARREQLEQRLFRIVELIHDKPTAYPICVREQMLGILALCMRWAVVRIVPLSTARSERRPHHRLWVEKAKRFMLTHHREKLRLADIAAHTGVDASHLNKLFRAATARSIIQYLNDLRIDEARHLMINGSMNITEIALLTGFRDSSYFAQRFRKATGRSPRQYMRQFRGR